MRGRSVGLDRLNDRLAEIAAVGDDVAGQRQWRDELRRRGPVGGLARGEDQPHRQARSVDDGVDPGAEPSTGATDGVVLAPLFPPAACWWARTIALSIRGSEPGDSSASASNTRSQTPAFAHLL